jgi:hypothetical protein
MVLSHQPQNALLIDGQLLDEAQICPDPVVAPDRMLSLERLNAREETLVPLSHPE